MATELLSVKKYAEQKGLNTGSVYKKIKKGLLKSKIENGKIYIMNLDEENKISEAEIINTISLELDEFDAMKKRISELETLTKYLDSIVSENRELREENKELRKLNSMIQTNISNVNKLEYKSESESSDKKLSIYLEEKGYVSKDRNKILGSARTKISDRFDERFIEKNGDIYINIHKFDYSDLF